MKKISVFASAFTLFLVINSGTGFAQNETYKVVFTGGYSTDPRDNGRPVALIAAALGVSPGVFRDAFSAVPPSPAGQEPDPSHVKKKKASLLSVLSPHGVTNERLDSVSDYYRYVDKNGEVWKREPASAIVILESGKITGIKLTNPGSGYTSAPVVTITNSTVNVKASIAFGTDLHKNGCIKSLTLEK